jgi:ABC-type multidrug transport system fused ATPase/permease subunit
LLGRTAREVLIAEDIDEKRIWEVLEMCCISDLVKEIGLNAPFKTVSGGQKQRLAIARAVLREPEILILDEGTSALDGINEQKVLQNLKNESGISFIIMIAHRT